MRLAAPERAVTHLGNADDALRVGELDSGRDDSLASPRPETNRDHMWLWVLFVEDMDRLNVITRAHRAVDGDGERNIIAVLDQRRHVERDLSLLQHGFADDTPNRLVEHGRRRRGPPNRQRRDKANPGR